MHVVLTHLPLLIGPCYYLTNVLLSFFCSYFLITCGIVYFYCTLYQEVDEEELGGIWELLKEGFMTSFAIFIVRK